VKVTTQDLADYIKLHPTRFKATASRNLAYAYFPATPSAQDDAATLNEINKLYLKEQMLLTEKISRIQRTILCS
jgi:peptidyl-prolyl cis-trans isomerase D